MALHQHLQDARHRRRNDRTSLIGYTFLGAEDFKGTKQSVTPVISVDSFNARASPICT